MLNTISKYTHKYTPVNIHILYISIYLNIQVSIFFGQGFHANVGTFCPKDLFQSQSSGESIQEKQASSACLIPISWINTVNFFSQKATKNTSLLGDPHNVVSRKPLKVTFKNLRQREQICGSQVGGQARERMRVWYQQRQAIIYRMDKQ